MNSWQKGAGQIGAPRRHIKGGVKTSASTPLLSNDNLFCPAINRDGQPELPTTGMTMYQAAVLAAGSFTWPLILLVFLARLPPNPKFHRQEFPGFAGAHL